VVSRVTVVGETGAPEHALAPWSIVGVGDFNGDGKADLLWRTKDGGGMQIWMMNGGQVVSRVTVVGETGAPEDALPPWSIVASY
jgi:hypothetical protein